MFFSFTRGISRAMAIRHLCIGAVLLILIANGVTAQTTSTTDGTTPSGIAPGSPSGSYALSDLDNVNLYNGNLNFALPLLGIGGRGAAGYEMILPLNDKSWRVQKIYDRINDAYKYRPDQSQWVKAAGLSPGALTGRQLGVDYQPTSCFGGNQHPNYPTKSITTLTFASPGETEHELRDVNTNGQPLPRVSCFVGASRGIVFATTDGSSITFVSDTAIVDQIVTAAQIFYPSGYLLLPNGTRYRIDSGRVSWIRDRNGNRVTFAYDANSRLSTITDSLNRQITLTYGGSDPAYYTDISYKGFGGVQRTIRVNYTTLSNALRPGYTIQTYGQLFPELYSSYPIDASVNLTNNPSIVSSLALPDGRQYQFFYDSYGELARSVVPTGGAVEYDMVAGSGVVSYTPTNEYEIFRRVAERRVYPDGSTGTTFESRTTFAATTNNPFDPKPWYTTVTVDHWSQGGTLLAREKHYFNGSGVGSLFKFFTTVSSSEFYSPWVDGKEYQTEALDISGNVLRRVVNVWQQRAPVSWWTAPADYAPANDPRVVESDSTLVDTNQVSKRTFSYDQYNNRTDVYEYDYGAGVSGPLVRRAHADYLTTNPVNGIDYTGTNIHLRSLPTQQQLFDASGIERARTTYEYDNYVADTNHAALTDRPSISGLDPSFTAGYGTRGSVTATTRYLLNSSGSIIGSISGYAQYDIAGNVVKAIDARGYATNLYFGDCFGAPDGNAGLNSAPIELSSVGQTSYAFVISAINALLQTAYSQYDFYTGRPVDAQDVNGVVASGYYSDLLDRPTQVRRAVGTAAENQTSFAYDDANRIITTTGDLTTNNDNALVGKVLYDGLGRTMETRQYEGGTNYIAVQTQYDAMGRAYKTSNPFRPWQSESAVWTTSAFDALGRVISVTTPDSAAVTSSYSGNTVTVTDQAGKARKSVTDGLGRLTTVYEDPSGLNYSTSYTYDVLDDLTTVSQGVQTRTFVYDSLKRLTSAANPESGTVSYGYDNNGNLLTRTDARSITTTIAYDVLNRPTSKSYNDSPQTPTVNYFYDSQSLPSGAPSFDRGSSNGRLVAVTYGGASAGNYYGFDALGRVVTKYQQTDSINYLIEATYYADSAVHTEVYPSVPGASDRRTVSFSYDSAARLSSLSSAATTYAPAASVSSIGYASHNALNTETYGNSLIHAITYNSRLQANEIKLGTSGAPTSVVDLTYNYGATNNNGNLQSVGYSGGGLSYTQSFGYDALNRLTTSNENSGSSWSQTNGYDQYGNRWIDYGGGNHNLSFSTNTNRITTSGFVYDAAGNLLNDTLHSYTFDAENKISKVDSVTAYTYDGEGQRVRKLVGENTRFVYGIGGQLGAEFDGSNGNLKKEYLCGSSMITIEPTAVNSNGTRYTTSDHLGSPRVVTNSSASVVSRHDYMPFGEELGLIGGRTTEMGYSVADGLRQKFTLKERDNETGLDYFGARYYASTQGRFTSVDPVGVKFDRLIDPQRLNRYAFVRNNPLKYVDADGNDLRLAPGLKKADQDRIIKDAVKLYRKASGRAALERMEKSDIKFEVGTGKLPTKTNLFQGVATENYGKTERAGFTGTPDPNNPGKVTAIDRTSGTVQITFDFGKRDDAQSAYDNGQRSKAPDSEQHLFDHETGHGDDMNNDMVKEFNQTEKDAEKNAEAFANGAENEKDTMSKEDAERRVRDIFGVPKQEKEKKKKNE